LGRLDAAHFLGGEMALDVYKAQAALARLAGRMGAESPQAAAWGVIRVANATMERAIRRISVERGHDPRRFALLAFGGAGPLHACDLALALNIPTVLVPRTPGVLSALGMLVADLVKDYSQTIMLRATQADGNLAQILEQHFRPLKGRGREDLNKEGVDPSNMSLSTALDVRYVGQSHELTMPVEPGQDILATFHKTHFKRFGHQHPDEPIEIVNVRVIARGRLTKPLFPTQELGKADPSAAHIGRKAVHFGPTPPLETQLYTRERLAAGNEIAGPAVIFQLDTTTVVPPGWRAGVDAYGTLVITRHPQS
jgi:N-methylhydantoinase A